MGIKFDGIPLKLIFGGPSIKKFGSLMGLGIFMNGRHQLMRMDYHAFDEGHGGSDGLKGREIDVKKDGDFHMHVYDWEHEH